MKRQCKRYQISPKHCLQCEGPAIIAPKLPGMECTLYVKINALIEQRDAIQKLIVILDKIRIRLEKPHLKGEKGYE